MPVLTKIVVQSACKSTLFLVFIMFLFSMLLLFSCAEEKEQENRAPTAPTILFSPAVPTAQEDLEITITSESTDADGDTISYIFEWSLDGALQSEQQQSVIPQDLLKGEQTWSVTVTPNDGTIDGESALAEIQISTQ